jgi:hypothetical protein
MCCHWAFQLLTQSGLSSECFIAFHVTIYPHRIAGYWGFLQAVRQRVWLGMRNVRANARGIRLAELAA